MKNYNENFFVISTGENTYVHYSNEGQKNTSWGDVLTAERFDTRKEAEAFCKEEFAEESGFVVKNVVMNITIW